jgi:hyperosmotically inducible protein
MNIKLTGLVLGTALSALAFTACESTSNTNANVNRAVNNGNVAVVVNSNTNATTANTYTVSTTNSWNANITKEEYEKNKGEYANKAKSAGDTIGSGAEDAWLWTKTKASLATTDDLRDSTINVDVDNSVVTLKGTVASAAQKTKAETVAKGVKDVKSVKNELKVAANDSMTNMSSSNSNSKSTNTNAKTK